MGSTSKIVLHEDSDELLELMQKEKHLLKRDRLQALYLLKSGEAQSINQVGRILGRNRASVQRWMCLYDKEGLEG